MHDDLESNLLSHGSINNNTQTHAPVAITINKKFSLSISQLKLIAQFLSSFKDVLNMSEVNKDFCDASFEEYSIRLITITIKNGLQAPPNSVSFKNTRISFAFPFRFHTVAYHPLIRFSKKEINQLLMSGDHFTIIQALRDDKSEIYKKIKAAFDNKKDPIRIEVVTYKREYTRSRDIYFIFVAITTIAALIIALLNHSPKIITPLRHRPNMIFPFCNYNPDILSERCENLKNPLSDTFKNFSGYVFNCLASSDTNLSLHQISKKIEALCANVIDCNAISRTLSPSVYSYLDDWKYTIGRSCENAPSSLYRFISIYAAILGPTFLVIYAFFRIFGGHLMCSTLRDSKSDQKIPSFILGRASRLFGVENSKPTNNHKATHAIIPQV